MEKDKKLVTKGICVGETNGKKKVRRREQWGDGIRKEMIDKVEAIRTIEEGIIVKK